MLESFKENLTAEEKNTYLQAMAYVLNCGNSSKQNNNKIMNAIAYKLWATNVTPKIMVLKKPEAISNKLLTIKNLRLRRYFMRDMVMLAVNNHEINDEEMSNLYKIGIALGIKNDKMNDFFLWAAQGIEWQISGQQMVEDDL